MLDAAARKKRQGKHSSNRPTLTRDELLALEDELIIEYQKEEFQRRLHELWGQAGDDEMAKIQARQEACFPIQLPIIEKYGFERSKAGVAASVYAYQKYDERDPDNVDFLERGHILTWLVNPPQQWRPKPYVPMPLWSAMRGNSGLDRATSEAESGLDTNVFTVVARQLSGAAVATVKLLPRDHIIRIREAIERKSLDQGRCVQPFQLLYRNTVLEDAQTAASVGLTEGAELSMIKLPSFQVLTASGDRTARLYDAATGDSLQVFSGHRAAVKSAAFSPDGLRVVTASKDKTAKIWNACTGECDLTLYGCTNAVNRAVFSPNGMCVATGSDDYMLKLFNATTGECEKSIFSGGVCVNDVAFSPDSKHVLVALGDDTARMLNLVTGEIVQTFGGHRSFINSAVFSPDGLKVATASDDGTARLFDTMTGVSHHQFTEHRRAVNSAEFSGDGRQLLTTSDDGNVLLFDTAMAACKRKFEHPRSVNSAVFSPDGRHVLTACNDHKARLFHAGSGGSVFELLGHQGAVYRASFGTS